MTWYAHQVFAEARPEVLTALRERFPGALFLLRNVVAEPWWPQLDPFDEDYPTGPFKKDPNAATLPMPPQGLLVVRELCHPGSGAAAWFGRDAVSWLLPDTYPDEPVLAPAAVFVGNQEWMLTGNGDVPPVALLRFLSRLSRASDTVISLYCAHTWGGTLEYAYAWVFEGRSAAGKVYVLPCDLEKGDIPGVRAWDPQIPDHPREIIVEGDVLTLTLDHHGIPLNGGFFEPHMRDFDWNQHRIG